jgi:O-acetyl-ADP-ribose deacetylase (regulator of RNase III)
MYKINKTEIELIKGDITSLDVESIVNPANNYLIHGGGLAAAIVRSGGQIIQQESKKIGFVPTGSAVITQGGHLKAKHVIHAVGPHYKDGKSGEAEKLASAVKSAIDIADKKKLKSIAIPAISSGIFGYPMAECSKVIIEAVIDYLYAKQKEKAETTIEKIVLCLFDEVAYNEFDIQFKSHFEKEIKSEPKQEPKTEPKLKKKTKAKSK